MLFRIGLAVLEASALVLLAGAKKVFLEDGQVQLLEKSPDAAKPPEPGIPQSKPRIWMNTFEYRKLLRL